MYFLSYEYVKELTAKKFGTEGGWALMGTILAGGSAGIANWAVGMPADVLKCKKSVHNFDDKMKIGTFVSLFSSNFFLQFILFASTSTNCSSWKLSEWHS